MTGDQGLALRISFVSEDTDLPVSSASEILARLSSGPAWDGVSIAPTDGQFPLLCVDWHAGKGFVVQCYEDAESWSDFLQAGPRCGPPVVEINLGGQTLEQWP